MRKIPDLFSSAINSRIPFASVDAPKCTFFFAIAATSCVAAARVNSLFPSNAAIVPSTDEDTTCATILCGAKLSNVFFMDKSNKRRSHCWSFVCSLSKLSFLVSRNSRGAASGDISSSDKSSTPFTLRAFKGKGKICEIRQRCTST